MKISNIIILYLAVMLAAVDVYAESLIVKIPGKDTSEYSLELPKKMLKLALEKVNKGYVIQESESSSMNRKRLFQSLKDNDGLDVMWAGTSPAREETFGVIRIPLYRGLMGNRVALIEKDRQVQFSQVKNIEDMKKFISGQPIGWVSVDIFKENGLAVQAAQYKSIAKMLETRHVDYFPMGIAEVFGAYEDIIANKYAKNIVIEKDLVFEYEFDIFFFVNKSNEQLRKDIENGLNIAYEDGSFMEVFNNDPSVIEAKRSLKNRRVIRLDTPFITENTANIDHKYWEQF